MCKECRDVTLILSQLTVILGGAKKITHNTYVFLRVLLWFLSVQVTEKGCDQVGKKGRRRVMHIISDVWDYFDYRKITRVLVWMMAFHPCMLQNNRIK